MGKITMQRGDDRTLKIVLNDTDGNPYPWANTKLWFTAKKSFADSDANAIIQKSTDDSDFDLSTPGVALAEIAKTETLVLPNKSVTLVYDVQLQRADNKIVTVDSGTIEVDPQVTAAG